MISLGSIKSNSPNQRTRRAVLEVGALGTLGLTLGDLLKLEASAQPNNKRAKSIILLWLWGGPSHLDTFDLKPRAPLEYRGPYSPIETSIPGTQICELLPSLAQRADQYSIIRSLHCQSNDHGVAGTIGLTGSQTGAKSLSGQVIAGDVQPTYGSIVSKVLGFDPVMPKFVTMGKFLHQGKKRIHGEGGGPLGATHDPFRIDYDLDTGIELPQLELIEGMTADGLFKRQELLSSLDRLARTADTSPAITRLSSFYQQAFSMLTSSKSRAVFDLEQEPQKVRRKYGKFRFGQSCLLARRLIESGVRFAQVNWSSHVEPIEDTGDGGWDMHDRNFQQFQDRHAWMLDQSVSALLDDLQDRGLLQDTIVIAVGEFGRTPKINGKSGRDHWHQCYSGLIAGGGINAGQVIGASDPRAEYPVQRPVTPADLFATALQAMGIGTTDLTKAGLAPLGESIEELL
jgi:hypothetical protein